MWHNAPTCRESESAQTVELAVSVQLISTAGEAASHVALQAARTPHVCLAARRACLPAALHCLPQSWVSELFYRALAHVLQAEMVVDTTMVGTVLNGLSQVGAVTAQV
jgi:hypothetical protein